MSINRIQTDKWYCFGILQRLLYKRTTWSKWSISKTQSLSISPKPKQQQQKKHIYTRISNRFTSYLNNFKEERASKQALILSPTHANILEIVQFQRWMATETATAMVMVRSMTIWKFRQSLTRSNFIVKSFLRSHVSKEMCACRWRRYCDRFV